MKRLEDEAAAVVLALQFMTRLPCPAAVAYTPDRQARSAYHYPLIGCLIGLFAALVYVTASYVFGPLLAALMAVGAAVLVTGALHEDGLADTCDALVGHVTPDRALEIMRDSRIGTYGTLGVVLVLGAKVLAIAEVSAAWVPWMLIAGHTLSRAVVLMVMAGSRYLRAQGAGSVVAGPRAYGGLAYAGTVTGIVLVAAPWLSREVVPPGAIVAAAGGGLVGALLTWRWFVRRLGGYTGDCLGATQQVAELGVYVTVAALC